MRRTKVAAITMLGALSGVAWPSLVHADEPIKATEPSLMSEAGDVVEVVDAFDEKNKDPFDLHLSLGFVQSWETAKIKRESNIGPDGNESTAGFGHNIENIAAYKHTWSTLNLRADIGLFHDLGFFFRVPLTLADDRSLDDLDGSKAGVNAPFGRASDTAGGQPFFTLPFKAPTRSGVDYVAAGLRFSIFNQHRDSTKPTWTIELEGRFGVGEPLHACNANATGGPECPTPGASTFNETTGLWERNSKDPGRSPGISRGTNAVKFGTLISNRYRYVEPYGGFWFMAEFQKRNTDMGDYSGVEGVITNHPPIQGGFIGGLMVHPWENLENFQRFTIDMRFKATYISQGRDYSAMFDALGSSNASSLVSPNPGNYEAGTDADGKPISVGNYRNKIHFTGVTDVEAHGIFGGQMAFIIQAGQYIKFNAGLGFSYVQAHLVSSSDACNPDLSDRPSTQAGRCRSQSASGAETVTGVPNPNHRPNIDLPGRRFRVTENFI
ncbi:MAG: hypothetical protein ABI175_06765, partial [Polyangiales bacterium]